MTAIFLIIWLVYNVHALVSNLRGRKRSSMSAQAMQTVLVLLALRWTWMSGALSRNLWSPLDIALGLALGHLLFAFSLAVTHQHLGDVLRHASDLRGMAAFIGKAPEICVRFLGVAAIEELVYRAAAQEMLTGLLNGPVPAIGVGTICFCLLHDHFLRNGFISAFEFFLFTLAVGVLYYYTSSLALVVLVHWVRNVESAYLDFCVMVETTHNEEEALRVLGGRHTSPVLESV